MSRESTADQRMPFSVVDEAVYLLDNEAEPWSIQLELRVAGTLDESRFRSAVADAPARDEVLGGLPSLPLWAKQAVAPLLCVSGNRLVDSALLSNIGELDEPPAFGPDAGDTTEMWFSAPARMPLGLSIGTLSVGGRLHLSYRYRHPQFDPQGVRRFAERYEGALDLLAPSNGR